MKRLLREFLNSVLILLGIFSACMGLKGFLLSSNFIDGGVTGVSMLLAKTTDLFHRSGDWAGNDDFVSVTLTIVVWFSPSVMTLELRNLK